MNNRIRSLSFVILFASLSASAFGIMGFLNTAYADTNMTKTGMNATVSANATASANMTGKMNGNMTGNMNSNTTGTTNTPPPAPKMMDPLQQFKAGTPAKTVQCGQGFSLVIKIEDGSPACVSPQVAQALVARGWGTTS
jgi:hypothetical protein